MKYSSVKVLKFKSISKYKFEINWGMISRDVLLSKMKTCLQQSTKSSFCFLCRWNSSGMKLVQLTIYITRLKVKRVWLPPSGFHKKVFMKTVLIEHSHIDLQEAGIETLLFSYNVITVIWAKTWIFEWIPRAKSFPMYAWWALIRK